jgi:broad specificity phosphatase PhoE
MNHLNGVDRLANRFSIMRHGQSKANARGIIVSCIENDRRDDYGLSELGRQQALAAARGCGLPMNTIICSSGFSRARQTAEIVRAHLGAPGVILAEALRERCFGEWEGSSTGNYAQVWAADETNPCYAGGNVEPAAAVLDRSTAFVVDLDRRFSGRDILLVSHGDTLQLLRAGFLQMNPSEHRTLSELKTAEIRQLRLPCGEPAPAPLPESAGHSGRSSPWPADGSAPSPMRSRTAAEPEQRRHGPSASRARIS